MILSTLNFGILLFPCIEVKVRIHVSRSFHNPIGKLILHYQNVEDISVFENMQKYLKHLLVTILNEGNFLSLGLPNRLFQFITSNAGIGGHRYITGNCGNSHASHCHDSENAR